MCIVLSVVFRNALCASRENHSQTQEEFFGLGTHGFCASCHDTTVVCVTCGHSDSPDALAWDISTGQPAGQPHCWRCFLEQKKPAVWKIFSNLCCHTCQTPNLTLHAFQPALAKEIFSNPKFSWSRQKPICLACTQKPLLTCSLCVVTASGIDFVSPDGTPPICYRCLFQRDHAIRFAIFYV